MLPDRLLEQPLQLCQALLDLRFLEDPELQVHNLCDAIIYIEKSHPHCRIARRRYHSGAWPRLHFCLGTIQSSLRVIHASCACLMSSSSISRSLLVALVVNPVSPLSAGGCCAPAERRCPASFSQDSAVFVVGSWAAAFDGACGSTLGDRSLRVFLF
jgi:hypothetical protein